MKKSPGLFTLALKVSSVDEVEHFCNSLQHFLMAVSWGGHESLIFPSCAVIDRKDFDASNINHRLVRFYIGLEDPDYLVQDIEQAFNKIQ
jgi:cystathionine beta-lyase/cystathionine gamma-synthase